MCSIHFCIVTRRHVSRDSLQQPVKEIDLISSRLIEHCHQVQSTACAYPDFKYLIEQLESHIVDLLVLKNR